MELRPLDPADADAVQALIESDPGYTERITGNPPGPGDGQSLLMSRPESLPAEAKVVLDGFEDGGLVAVVELLQDLPHACRSHKVTSTVRLYEKPLRWGHPHLAVRDSGIAGQGLFATASIAAGEVVSVLAGRKVSTAELTELLKNPPVDTITLEDDLHLVLPTDPRPPIAYGNHSCDPTTRWTDAVPLAARRDIAPDDEITSDYGTSIGIADWQMSCACGSSLCLGLITGSDWQLQGLQHRYGDHWIPTLLAR